MPWPRVCEGVQIPPKTKKSACTAKWKYLYSIVTPNPQHLLTQEMLLLEVTPAWQILFPLIIQVESANPNYSVTKVIGLAFKELKQWIL